MSELGSDQLGVYYSKIDESVEASGSDHVMLTDKDLAKIHIAASSRSVIEMANAVSSIDSLMAILETRLQNRAMLAESEAEKKGSTIEVEKSETTSKIYAVKKARKTSEKPKQSYTCETCGYVTMRRGDYNKHILIHSGIKPYHCPLCNYKTTEKCRLNRHLESKLHTGEPRVQKRTKVAGSEIMLFSCDQCEYQTTDSADMLAHKSNMHTSNQHIPQFVSTEEVSDEAGGGRLVTLYAVTEPGLIPTTDITIHGDTMSDHHHTTDLISQQEQTTHHITDSHDINTEAPLGEPT